jgi:hypothetical protein
LGRAVLDTTGAGLHARRVGDAHQPAVVGVADHSGWANLVTVGTIDGRPVVVDRRRCELVGPAVPRQPYHAADGLAAADAEALVASVTEAARSGARSTLTALCADVDNDCRVVALTLRAARGRPLPDTVAGVLASHSAMHAAEGRLYRDALAAAASERGLALATYDRGTAIAVAATTLATTAEGIAATVTELGRALGPPWRAEHREATAAALCELAHHADLRLDV